MRINTFGCSVRTGHRSAEATTTAAETAILVDFDGTACSIDVGTAVCERFSRGGWQALDVAAREGRISLRQAIDRQTTLLEATPDEMLAWTLERFEIDPTFVALASWAEEQETHITIVSDGPGFYIRPMLAAAGLAEIAVRANHVVRTANGLRMDHPDGHPECVGCGTCKMLAVLDARTACRRVAFAGDGETDRFAALYADVVFAKDRLAALCGARGAGHIPWKDFDDVRQTLTALAAHQESAVVRPAAPSPCPGWTTRAVEYKGGLV